MMRQKNILNQTTLIQKVILMLPWAIILLGVGITLFIWNQQKNLVEVNAAARYERELERTRAEIFTRFRSYDNLHASSRGLFMGSDGVSRDEWRDYVLGLDIQVRYPGINGVGFIEYVPQSRRAEFEAEIRGYNPALSVRQIPPGNLTENDFAYIIKYAEPASQNEKGIGYDITGEPQRREAADKARDNGRSTLTKQTIKLEESDLETGLVLYTPVYRRGAPVNTTEEQRTALVGWVYSPIKLSEMLKDVLGQNANDFAFRLYDGYTAQSENLLYSSPLKNGLSPDYNSNYTRRMTLSLENRVWMLEFFTLPGFSNSANLDQPNTLLMVGVIATLILFVMALWMADAQVTNTQITSQRNAELQNALSELEERQQTGQNVSAKVLNLAVALNAAAGQQSESSQEQVMLVGEVSGSLSELSSAAVNIDEMAARVSNLAQTVAADSCQIETTTQLSAGQSEQGLRCIENTLSASREVSALYQQLLLLFDEWTRRNTDMRLILRLLNQIANETHLLALNAAIEAAGAGERGDRFKVVAQNIRVLAGRSATASQEVVGIIGSVEEVARNAQELVQNGNAKTEIMANTIEETSLVIRQMRAVTEQAEKQASSINRSIGEVTALIETIRGATGQQRAANEQVVEAIAGLNEVARQNDVSSRQLSDAALNLENLSQKLTLKLAA
jgi:methyl-accepting chemotaxis protein